MTSSPSTTNLPFTAIASNVCILTSGSGESRVGCTVAAWGESNEPPMLYTTLRATSRTLTVIEETGAFSVNVLSDHLADIGRLFGDPSKTHTERFDLGFWEPSEYYGPVLRDALAYYCADLQTTYRIGTDVLLLGIVRRSKESDGALPLIHYRGKFVALGSQIGSIVPDHRSNR